MQIFYEMGIEYPAWKTAQIKLKILLVKLWVTFQSGEIRILLGN